MYLGAGSTGDRLRAVRRAVCTLARSALPALRQRVCRLCRLPRLCTLRRRLARRFAAAQTLLLAGLFLLSFSGATALAAPSGLNVIPTADILETGILDLEGEINGEKIVPGNQQGWGLLSQFGLTPRVELGADLVSDDEGERILLNVKWLIFPKPALALGVQNVSHRQQMEPYLVATHPLGKTRLHAGLVTGAGTGLLAGVDHLCSPRLVLQGDYMGGSEGSASLGVAWQVLVPVNLSYAFLFSTDERPSCLLNLAFTLRP